jgi:hypothetical protein
VSQIATAETRFLTTRIEMARQGKIIPPDRMAELMIHAAAPVVHQRHIPVPVSMRQDKPARAFVNDGRWVIQCECAGAQIASREDRRFFCCDCLNVITAGAWRPVEWPANSDEIEEVLSLRPDPKQRNWNWNETADQLRAENVEHGVPV